MQENPEAANSPADTSSGEVSPHSTPASARRRRRSSPAGAAVGASDDEVVVVCSDEESAEAPMLGVPGLGVSGAVALPPQAESATARRPALIAVRRVIRRPISLTLAADHPLLAFMSAACDRLRATMTWPVRGSHARLSGGAQPCMCAEPGGGRWAWLSVGKVPLLRGATSWRRWCRGGGRRAVREGRGHAVCALA